MKRLLSLLLPILLLASPAAANSWGLKGDLLSAVMADDTWDDYTAMSDQVGNIAAMESRYHNALMLVMDEDADLEVYTRALWQPGERTMSAKLTRKTDGFSLSYGTEESYQFTLRGGEYVLTLAEYRQFRIELVRDDGLYLCSSPFYEETVRWFVYNGLTLDRFSIRLLPHSLEEARRLNRMNAALDSLWEFSSWLDPLQPGRKYSKLGSKTVPVYAAPTEDAWRASKGKAAVSLKGDVWVLEKWVDAAGDSWYRIHYEVSQRTHRFGFIRAKDVAKDVTAALPPEMSVPVRFVTESPVTDDPLVSQYAQTIMSAGTTALAVGLLNDEYALVITELNGQEAWLYAPLKDLEPIMGATDFGVMAQLEGCWYYSAGGSMSAEYLRLNADGSFYDPSYPEVHGMWDVTVYDPNRGLYWDNPPYEITFFYADGRRNVKGLSLMDADPETGVIPGFNLSNWEGSGGYERMNETDVPRREYEDGNG